MRRQQWREMTQCTQLFVVTMSVGNICDAPLKSHNGQCLSVH